MSVVGRTEGTLRCKIKCRGLQERVGPVLGNDAVGLGLLGLVLRLELVGDAVVLVGEPFLGLESGNAAGA